VTLSQVNELAAEFERGKPWTPKKDGSHPRTLIGEVAGWSKGSTVHGPADFLTLRDRDGELWSIIVTNYKLKKALLDGEVSSWDDQQQAFIVLSNDGPVQPGDAVAIEFRGTKDFTTKDGRKVQDAPDYRVQVKRDSNGIVATGETQSIAELDGDIPFMPTI
jgi:hypothetical protein